MGYSTDAKNALLDYLATLAVKASLHTDEPGDTGANEVTGGSYARQTCGWASASGGSISDDGNSPAFSIPAGNTIRFVGFWNTGGTVWYGSADLTEEMFTADGIYTLTSAILDLNG